MYRMQCAVCFVLLCLYCMMTSSNGHIFRFTSHLCGDFTGPRRIPRTKASDAELWCFFDLRLNKSLNNQSWGRWFETLSRPLWRHRNGQLRVNSRDLFVLIIENYFTKIGQSYNSRIYPMPFPWAFSWLQIFECKLRITVMNFIGFLFTRLVKICVKC